MPTFAQTVKRAMDANRAPRVKPEPPPPPATSAERSARYRASLERRHAERARIRPVPMWQAHRAILGPQKEKVSALTIGFTESLVMVPPELAHDDSEAAEAQRRFYAKDTGKTTFRHEPPKGPAVSAADVLARLEERGLTMHLTPNADKLVLTAKGGHAGAELLAVVRDFTPLLVAGLGGTPLGCDFDCSQPAVTLLAGGAGACQKHLAGEEP